jgi:hypothetical protein
MAAQIIVAGLTCLVQALMLRAASLLSPVPVGALLAPVSKWTAVAGCAVIVLGIAVAALPQEVAAWSIRSAMAPGREASEAWLASRSIVVRGCMRSAMRRFASGWIIRSLVDTWYHVGFFFQAGSQMVFPNVEPTGASSARHAANYLRDGRTGVLSEPSRLVPGSELR